VALALTGQTINLMTLGGLALAVGILVDESTVEVENIHTQMEKTDSIALAVRRGNSETAVPRLLAMLSILAVFVPAFFMQGAARALFVPLSLAVGFAMIASYFLSSTFVPVMSVWLMKKSHASSAAGFMSQRIGDIVAGFTTRRFLVGALYVPIAALIVVGLGSRLGVEIFPQVDAGFFQFRLRAPTGTRIEQTEDMTREALAFIKQKV